MPNVLTIYRREMGSYFTSPIAYIFICVFLVVMGVYFFLLNGFFQHSFNIAYIHYLNLHPHLKGGCQVELTFLQ